MNSWRIIENDEPKNSPKELIQTLWPSKAHDDSSEPISSLGEQDTVAQPTRIEPGVETSNSKYLQRRRHVTKNPIR